ncbi:hypothetical protein GCM10023191_035880 [Actinoallomurus oryzae]|uniref:GNAT family N-acetyltransferase n=1 Tax=Actinoallomurus oryzae TaxID=502180 RepID=A0ABP8Q2N5_9ACTN
MSADLVIRSARPGDAAAAERPAGDLGCVRMEVTGGRHRDGSHPFYRHLGYEDSGDRGVRYLKDLPPS